jgi:membrane-associated protein
MNFISHLFDAKSIVGDLGLVGIAAIIFAESGLLIGLAFPGDSLLFIAGIAASSAGKELLGGASLNTTRVFVIAPLAAILGAQAGHALGKKFGPKIFDRPEGRFFTRDRVIKTEKWLTKYGVGKAVVLARFIPFVRTLLNPLVGTIGYPAKKFFLWNVLGAIVWTQLVLGLGFALGSKITGSVDRIIFPIVGVIIVVSLVPILIEVLKEWRTKKDLS